MLELYSGMSVIKFKILYRRQYFRFVFTRLRIAPTGKSGECVCLRFKYDFVGFAEMLP